MREREQKILALFLGLHFVLWLVVGTILSSLPMDTAEAIVWGGEWTFITNKHPYLSGWVAELFCQLFGNARLAMAVLSATCSTAALWFAYRLARQFMDRPRAVVSALLLEGCIYYSAYSLKYNCNVLSAALAPLFFWMAWRALRTDSWRHWIATGLVAGALAMTKYSNGALLAGVVAYVLIWRRDVFRRPGAYFAGALCLGICLPHLIALIQSDFSAFSYVQGSAEAVTPSVWEHFRSPIWFLVAQAFNSWGSLALIAFAVGTKRFKARSVPPYLLFVGLLPVLSFPCFAAVTATPLKDMWGFAFASVLPLIVLAGMELRPNLARWLIRLSFVALVVQVLVMTLVALFHTSRSWLDVDALVRELPVKDPAFIGGEVWLCSEVALSLERRPHVLYDMDFRKCPWISRDELNRNGCLVLTDDLTDFSSMRERYPALRPVREILLTVKAPFGKKKPSAVYVGYLPPESLE